MGVTFGGAIKDGKNLLLPCVAVRAIIAVITVIKSGCSISEVIVENVKILIWGNGRWGEQADMWSSFSGMGIGPLWFLITLFWGKLLYRIICIVFKEKHRQFLCLLLPAIGICIGKRVYLPQNIDICFVSILFFEAGKVLKQYFQKEKTKNYFIQLGLLCVWLYMTIFLKVTLNMSDRYYPFYIVSVFVAILGSYFVMEFARVIDKVLKKDVIGFVGRNSLIVLCIHTLDTYMLPSLMLFLPCRLAFDLGIMFVCNLGNDYMKQVKIDVRGKK